PWVLPRDWLHQAAAVWLLRFAQWFVIIGAIALMPDVVNWQTWMLMCGVLLLYAVWVWGGLVWCGQKLGLFVAPSDRLGKIVADVSAKMNVAVREVFLLRGAGPTAYALVYTRGLLFSDRLLELLPDDEIAAI